VPTGRVFIDGTRTGEIGDEVLRDRKHLAADGVVVPVVAINRQTGKVEGCPTSSPAAWCATRRFLQDAPDHVIEIIASASVEDAPTPASSARSCATTCSACFAGARVVVP
jgi:ribonuclease J